MEHSLECDKDDEDREWSFLPGEITLTDQVLGRGAFGEVRIAKWRNIEVACKTLHTIDPSQEDQLDVENLKHEITMLSKLRHPNLVLFLGVCQGLVNNTTSILTELLPCSLYDILEVNKTILQLPDILDISLDISYGLDYLHKHNPQIVHRDISSKNILIGGNKAKIADLGQAKIFQNSHNSNTNSRQTSMPGAMAYSAPEVLTGKYTSKIDIYSYGILLSQMCNNLYPRIERREEQLLLSYEKQPLLKNLILLCVNYQHSERPTAAYICQYLETIKENDRNYPLSRKILPEKDIGILSRNWMNNEINKYNLNLNIELNKTKSLLNSEEIRWKKEAEKVDILTHECNDMKRLYNTTLEEYNNLKIEYNNINNKFNQCNSNNNNLKTQLNIINSEIILLKQNNQYKDQQIEEQLNNINKYNETMNQYQEDYQIISNLLENSRYNENNFIKNNEKLKKQLDIQVEYNRDLEIRLEQALTRWKLEKEQLKDEKMKYNKLNTKTSNIVAINERQKLDIERYEARLAQYKDLPLPVRNMGIAIYSTMLWLYIVCYKIHIYFTLYYIYTIPYTILCIYCTITILLLSKYYA